MNRCLPARAVLLVSLLSILWAAPLSASEARPTLTRPVLVVPAADDTLHLAVPLPKGRSLDAKAAWRLVEVGHPDVSAKAEFVPAIAADGTVAPNQWRLSADLPPRAGVKGTRRFELVDSSTESDKEGKHSLFAWKDDGKASLALSEGDRPVLVYNYDTITNPSVPKKERRRSQAAFIHPVYGLSGEVLTDSFPRDHYHHHGIFWTWPHVGIVGKDHDVGKDYDLWTSKGIRTRFVRRLDETAGRASALLAVENGWFVGEKKVMIERVWILAHASDGQSQALDLEFTWIPVEHAITLRGAENKSYGGLTMRFLVPRGQKATITVPSGVAKRDLPETPLPWADLTHRFPGASTASGASIMAPADHPDFPPTWLTRGYGPMCIGYPGVEGKTFPAGQPIRLRYRVWIHKTPADLARLKAAYAAYGAGQGAKWE